MFLSKRIESIHTRVALCVRGSGGKLIGVVVGNIGGNSTKGLGLASCCIDACEEVSGGANVGGPSKPSTVSSLFRN